jgi:hypothetical protein
MPASQPQPATPERRNGRSSTDDANDRIGGGVFSLRSRYAGRYLFQFEAITTDLPKSYATMADSITRFRDAYKKDPTILDSTFPVQHFTPRYPMRFVVCGLMRSFVTDRFKIDDRHIRTAARAMQSQDLT